MLLLMGSLLVAEGSKLVMMLLILVLWLLCPDSDVLRVNWILSVSLCVEVRRNW